jgi:DNA invertase Pin-like site-specific DNA recombinase
MKTVLYARVSTTEQTLDHQKAQAEAAGFNLDLVLADHGVSGVSVPLRERPEGRRLFDVLREGDTLVVRWIDRLGRNYADVTETVRDLIARGVTIRTVINGMTFDGQSTDPMSKAVRDALLGFMAAMAEAQAETTREAQAAGIEAAKERKVYLGRKPSFDRRQLGDVLDLLGRGEAPARIAREVGVSRQTVYRIRDDPAGAERALSVWGA